MAEFYKIVAYVMSGILGLCVGSFLNVVIYRVPLGMSLAKPDSHCPVCKKKLKWYDNIPVLSYILLLGKCRNCKTHIPFRYTAVELCNMLSWLLCVFLFWDRSIPLACIYAAACSVFLCVFFIDLEHKLIFDRFVIILLALGVAVTVLDKEYGWLSHVIGGAAGFSLFFLVGWAFEKLCKKEGLGGGDVKLVGAAGLLLGWQKLLLAVLVATIPAAIIMGVITLVKTRKQGEPEEENAEEDGQFPFAPFLVTGFAFAMLFGTQIVDWYLRLLGV